MHSRLPLLFRTFRTANEMSALMKMPPLLLLHVISALRLITTRGAGSCLWLSCWSVLVVLDWTASNQFTSYLQTVRPGGTQIFSSVHCCAVTKFACTLRQSQPCIFRQEQPHLSVHTDPLQTWYSRRIRRVFQVQ